MTPDSIFQTYLKAESGKDTILISTVIDKQQAADSGQSDTIVNYESQNQMTRALVKSTAFILENGALVENDVSLVQLKGKQSKAVDQMKKVNDLNWQWFLVSYQGKVGGSTLKLKKPLPDYDCILIGVQNQKIKNDKKTRKHLEIVTIGV